MRHYKPSLLLLLSTLLCLAAVLASNQDTALVTASPYPSTNPFDRIIHILRRKIAEPLEGQDNSDPSSPSASGSDRAAASGPTTTVTVYLPARTDGPSSSDATRRQTGNQDDEDDGFAGIFGSGAGPRFTQSNGASAFGQGMGAVLASEARDASPQFALASAAASARAEPEPRFSFGHQASVQDAAHGFEDADHLDYSVVAAAHAHASVSHGTAAMMSRGIDAGVVGKDGVEGAGGALFDIEDHAEESLFALADLVGGEEGVGEAADNLFSVQDGIIAESLDVADFL